MPGPLVEVDEGGVLFGEHFSDKRVLLLLHLFSQTGRKSSNSIRPIRTYQAWIRAAFMWM
jgi:hypothetical protein